MLSVLLGAIKAEDVDSPLKWYNVNYQTWSQWRSDFDIKYNGYQTTYNNYGWWPVMKVDDYDYVPILGKNQGVQSQQNVVVTTNLSYPLGKNYLLIQFIATNNDDDPHYISIASHTDIYLAQNDYASVYWYDGNRGLTMTDDTGYGGYGYNPTYLTLTLLVRDGYCVTNVDDFWFGHWEYANQHYWENRTDRNALTRTDSAFSFGWWKRPIYPNETQKYGVLLGIGKNLKNPPTISLISTLKENYLPGETVNVKVNVQDIDSDENVTLYYNFTKNGVTEKGHFGPVLGNQINQDFTIPITLGTTVDKYPLIIWAQDNETYTSNVIEQDFLVNEAPVLTITNQINDKYYTGGAVELQGTVWDDTYVTIRYSIDDSFYYNIGDGNIVCNKSTIPFRTVFLLKDKNLNYGTHTLRIWAIDQFSVKSQVFSYTFQYIELHTPEIRVIENEIPTQYYNDYIMITGQVRDLDFGDTLMIYYLPPTSSALDSFQYLDTVQATGDWTNFTMIYQIPYMTTTGNQQITFKVVDQTGANSLYAYYTYNYEKHSVPSAAPSPTPIIVPTIPPNYTGPTDYTTTESYTESSTTDINGDPTSTWVITNITYTITTDVARRTPTPSATPTSVAAAAGAGVAPVAQKSSGINKYIPIIAGCAAAVVAAAIIAGVIIAHEAKKKAAEFNFEDAEFEDQQDPGMEMDNENPVYDEDAQDDPFANEFDEQDEAENVFPQ